jgi:GNAT superfamily N-acetyltransferase
MIVRRYTDPVAYRDRVAPFLAREEAANNLPLGIVYRLAEPAHRERQPPLLALVEEEGEVVLVMIMTPPHNVIVVGPADNLPPTQPLRPRGALDAAVAFLLREDISPPGVIGARPLAAQFAAAWCARAGCTAEVRTEQMIYCLDRVTPVAHSPGSLVQATEAHLDLMTEWLVGFSEVTPQRLAHDEARERAEEMIGGGRLYLWHDAAPVSMAWRARPTQHGITVSGVYTPPALRRRGYATSCVAALSQLLLDEGYAYCTLYTDLSNPTSNHIYQEIGYRPIQASIDLTFAPATG